MHPARLSLVVLGAWPVLASPAPAACTEEGGAHTERGWNTHIACIHRQVAVTTCLAMTGEAEVSPQHNMWEAPSVRCSSRASPSLPAYRNSEGRSAATMCSKSCSYEPGWSQPPYPPRSRCSSPHARRLAQLPGPLEAHGIPQDVCLRHDANEGVSLDHREATDLALKHQADRLLGGGLRRDRNRGLTHPKLAKISWLLRTFGD
jgi:hypothetical protein